MTKQEFYKQVEKRAREGVENYISALYPKNPNHEPSQEMADMFFDSMVEAIVSRCGMFASNVVSETFHRMHEKETDTE